MKPELLLELMNLVEDPKDLFGPEGVLQQLKGALLERMLEGESLATTSADLVGIERWQGAAVRSAGHSDHEAPEDGRDEGDADRQSAGFGPARERQNVGSPVRRPRQ
jgi:hypothetical protein